MSATGAVCVGFFSVLFSLKKKMLHDCMGVFVLMYESPIYQGPGLQCLLKFKVDLN